MTIPVNFKSFKNLCPNYDIDKDKFQANALHNSVKGFAGCYLVKTTIYDKLTNTNQTYYKVGYKGRTEEGDSNRIKDYGRQGIECLGFLFQEKTDEREFDIKIHKILRSHYNYIFEKGIFFGNDEEGCHFKNFEENDDKFINDVIQACSHYRNDTKPKKEKEWFWGPRIGSQDICINKAINWFSRKDNNNYFLIAMKCRGGKSYTTTKIIQELENRNLVKSKLHFINTFRPGDTIKEWYDTCILHNDFNFDFYVHPQYLKDCPNAKSLDDLKNATSGIVFASSQCLERNVDGEYSKYSQLLQSISWGVCATDEDDVGCNKDNAKSFREDKLKIEKHIRITGTAYEEILFENKIFYSDNTYIWDYVDEQKAKEKYKSLGPNNPYKDMAKINLYEIDLAKKIYDENPSDFDNDGFTLNEFFRTDETTHKTFIHDTQVTKFLKKTFDSDECNEDEEHLCIFENKFDGEKIKHAIIKVPMNTIDAFENKFVELSEKNPFKNKFKFIKITGESPDATTKKEIIEKIEAADLAGKTSIVYTVYKGGRGISVGHWNTMIHWAGTEDSGISNYEQFNYRVQTPFTNKEIGLVFDYAPNRVLVMQQNFASLRAKTHNLPYEETYKEVVNYFPAFKYCDKNWKTLNYDEVINELRNIRDEKKIENNVITNSPIGFIEKQSEENFKFKINDIDFLTKLKYKGKRKKNKIEHILSPEEIKEQQGRLRIDYIKKQQKNFFIFFKKTLKFVWVKNNGLPFGSNVYHKLIYNKEVQDWISNVYEVPENFYSLLEEAFSNNAWEVSVDEFLKLTYDNKKFDEICPTVISKINSDYKTPNNLVSNCWDKVKVNEINNFVEVCSKCGEFAKFGIENYKLKKEKCYFVARSSWCAALTSLNIYNDYDYTKYNTIKIVNIDNSDINNKLNLKEMFDMKHLDLLLGNPPYGIKVEEGRKRSLDLDLPIWDELKEQLPNTEIHLLMKSTHSHKNGHGFTAVEDKGKFEGVSQDVSLYSSVPNEPELKFVVSKHNEKHNWINENDKSNTNHSLNQMIDHKYEANHPNTQIVPNNYIVLSQVCTRNFKIWLPGESLVKTNGKIHTMKVFIPTNKPNELKNYLINVVQPKHNEFRTKYKDQNIDRGFAKTIEIPSEYWVEDEFVQ